jgi:hypothetical protein
VVQSLTLCSATLGEDGRRQPPGGPLFDSHICHLLAYQDAPLRAELLAIRQYPTDRIGVGLALSFFRHTRRRAQQTSGNRLFTGDRGPGIVRQRLEPAENAWLGRRP